MKQGIHRAGILLSGFFVFILSAYAQTPAPQVEVPRADDNPALRSASFDFRFSGVFNPPSVAAATAVIQNAAGGASVEAGFTPWKNTGQTSAFVFLVETRSSRRNATVAAFAKLMEEVARSRQTPTFGLYTFGDKLDRRVALGKGAIDFYEAAQKLGSFEPDRRTRPIAFYASAQAAIADLAAFSADRKALVILGSGRNTGDSLLLDSVMEAAKNNKVVIYAVGVSETPEEAPFLQLLQQLAASTGGAYQGLQKANDSVLMPPGMAASLLAGLESGGRVRFDFPQTMRGKTSYEVALRLGDGNVIRVPSRQLDLPEVPAQVPALRVEEEIGVSVENVVPGELIKISESTAKDARAETIDFRFREPVNVDGAEWDGAKPAGGEAPKVNFTSWRDSRQTTAWYFLLDVSSQGEKDPAPAIFRATVSRLLDENPGGSRDFGLATVGPDFSEITALGAFSVKKLSDELASGSAWEKKSPQCNLLSAATAAIGRLADRRAERKVLVILGSGRSESANGAYSFDSVKKLAAEKNVIIQTVGFNPDNGSALQLLRSLSEGTQGMHTEVRYDATARKAFVPKGFFEKTYRSVENGGRVTVTFPDSAKERQEIKLKLSLAGGKTAALTGELPAVEAALANSGTGATTTATGTVTTTGTGALVTPAPTPEPSFWDKYLTLPYIIGTIVVLLLIILVAILLLRLRAHRRQSEGYMVEMDNGEGMPPPPDITQLTNTHLSPSGAGNVLAWLEMMDESRKRHAMNRPAFRVGRNSSNDLVFSNDSVSGFHAEILSSRDGRFTITDLDSSNGTLVNGHRVDAAHLLENNDVVELGEVKFRFLRNS